MKCCCRPPWGWLVGIGLPLLGALIASITGSQNPSSTDFRARFDEFRWQITDFWQPRIRCPGGLKQLRLSVQGLAAEPKDFSLGGGPGATWSI